MTRNKKITDLAVSSGKTLYKYGKKYIETYHLEPMKVEAKKTKRRKKKKGHGAFGIYLDPEW